MAGDGSAIGSRIRDVMEDGGLVPDEVTDKAVRRRLEAIPAEQGVILDGYPRSAAQADTLRRLLAQSGRLVPRPLVVRLDVPVDELLHRLRRRRRMEGRADDTDEVIRSRLQIHDAEAARAVDAMSDWADVVEIDGAQPPEAVGQEVLEKLGVGGDGTSTGASGTVARW